MKTKTKIRQWGLATVTVAFSLLGITNIARADYWTRHTRDSSNNVLPQYFELENMAKSSGGTRLFYGTNRIGGVGAGADANHTRHLISYDGTNWTDRTAAAKTAGGYSDLEFYNMYQDTNDNVWMPNRKDPNRTLIRYRGASGAFDSFSATAIAQQVDPGIGSLKVNNLFTGPGGQI